MRQAVAYKEMNNLLDFMLKGQWQRYRGKPSRKSGSIRGHEGESPSMGALARTRKLSLGRRCEAQSEGDVEAERSIGGLAGQNESEAHKGPGKSMTVRNIGKSALKVGMSQPDSEDLSGDGARHVKKEDATTL